MLAEEYGYQLSPQAAEVMTPGLGPEVDRALAEATRAKSIGDTIGCGCFAVVFVCGVLIGLATGDDWGLPVVISIIVGALAYGAATNRRDAELRERKQIAASVRGAHWQVWPCRAEEVPQQPLKRLLLLAPDQSVAREFRCALPEDVWLGMTDGRGLVWFVGDLRFGGVVALPGGSPLWWARVPKVTSSPSTSTGTERLIEEELTRRAISFLFDQ